MRDLKKLKQVLKHLEDALKKDAKNNPLIQAGISKLFEVCFEYTWKAMKENIQSTGLEAFSPRDVIKSAGQTGLISNVELWLSFLEDRNLSVHDYIGIEDKVYLQNIHVFVKELKRVLPKLSEA